ncbi:MAG: O-antigen ligase family protein [Caldilineaceae bacterium]|nr:O-antigen ligase family protein [Caldilineaceae bacterium]
MAAGMAPVLVLDGSPTWARAPRDRAPVDNPLAPPADFADFAAFGAAAAQRYGDRVTFYQIWDEPNVAPHWGDRHIEPVHYTQLLRVATRAIRAADADAVIIGAALAPTTDRGHTAMDEVRFLQRMLAAGARESLDAVAVQPFGFGATPGDARRRIDVLNAQRAALLRRTLTAAGAADLPIIAARFGWNDRPNSPWRTVLEPQRTAFVQEFLELARREWPWLAGAGWAVDRPDAPADDPAWGFATDAALLGALRDGAAVAPQPQTGWANRVAWMWLVLASVATVVAGWRLVRAAHVAGWRTWLVWLRARPGWQFGLWLVLLLAYFLATWPPLVLLLLGAAAVLVWVQPRSALWLGVFLLPFHIYHKELHFAAGTLFLPPTQAVMLAALPTLILARRGRSTRPSWTLVGFDGLALGWLVLGAAALHVRYWPGYIQGMADLVVTPLLLYALVRRSAPDAQARRRVAAALFAGGVLAALVGLTGWVSGAGTVADGLRRLVGPYFSPNHTALYLERTLFLGIGIWYGVGRGTVRRGPAHLAIGVAVTLVGLALLLTASRGALLLGLPAGIVVFFWLAPMRRMRMRGAVSVGVIGGLAVVALVLLVMLPRLANTATVLERVDIWRATLALWRDVPIFGVGAGGFYWTFPAYIPVQAAIDPNLRHPHNVWLETLAGWGVLGGIWMVGLLVQLVRTASALSRADELTRRDVWLAAGLLAGLAAGFAHGQVDAFLTLPDLAGWNWVALALLAQMTTVSRRENRRAARQHLPPDGPAEKGES